MKTVYIVHPIAGDVMENVGKILNIVRDINLTMPEVLPFAPYVVDVLAMDDNKPEERLRGIKNDTAMLNSGIVNELWVYGPKISAGMQNEICLAHSIGIPIILKDAKTFIPAFLKEVVIPFKKEGNENNEG